MEILGTLEVTITRFKMAKTPAAFVYVGKKLLGVVSQLPNSKWCNISGTKQFWKIHEAVNDILQEEGYI